MVQTVLCENPKEPIPGLGIPAILKSTLVSPPEALWGPTRGPKGSHESGQLWRDHHMEPQARELKEWPRP